MSRGGRPASPAVLGVFRHPDQLAAAVERLREGRRRFTIFSPVRGEWLDELAGRSPSPVGFVVLVSGLAGAAAGVGLALYTTLPFPMVVSGKPVVPVVPMVVVAFEFMVLVGVLSLFAILLVFGGIPRRRLPESYDARFSQDRFGLLVAEAGEGDPVRELLRAAGAEEVRDVPE